MQVSRFHTIKSILFWLITITRSHRFYPEPENCDHILDTRNHGSWKNFVKNGKWKRINVRGGKNGVITKSKHPNIDSVFYSRKPNSTKYNELVDKPTSYSAFKNLWPTTSIWSFLAIFGRLALRACFIGQF